MSKVDSESGNGAPKKTRTSSKEPTLPQGVDSETSLLESAARLTGGLATGAIKEMIKDGIKERMKVTIKITIKAGMTAGIVARGRTTESY